MCPRLKLFWLVDVCGTGKMPFLCCSHDNYYSCFTAYFTSVSQVSSYKSVQPEDGWISRDKIRTDPNCFIPCLSCPTAFEAEYKLESVRMYFKKECGYT